MEQQPGVEGTKTFYEINQLTFQPKTNHIVVGISAKKGNNRYSIHYKELPEFVGKSFKGLDNQHPNLYLDFSGAGDLKADIVLADHPAVARMYYYHLLTDFFLQEKKTVKAQFIKTPEIWIRYKQEPNGLHPLARYSLKVILPDDSQKHRLRIAFEGFSYIQGQNLMELSKEHPEAVEHVRQVVYQHRVLPLDRLPEEALANRNELYPILNRKIAAASGISYPFRRDLKKHGTYLRMIQLFKDRYLYHKNLQEYFSFSEEWLCLPKEKVQRLDTTEPTYVFANRETGTDIRTGLLQYGPYHPVTKKQVRIFFIYHNSDKEVKEKIKEYLNGEHGKGLTDYIKTPVFFDESLDFAFQDKTNPVQEIQNHISGVTLNPDSGYLGLYISPYDKTVSLTAQHRIYYLVKETLLQRNIAPQTLDAVRVGQAGTDFRFWIPNLATAAIGKLGGIPWGLNGNESRDLVVGFGLYATQKYNLRVVGSSVCFTAEGVLRDYDFFPEDEHYRTAAALEKALLRYAGSENELHRLVIHYYKKMGKKAFRPIQEMLDRLQPGMPIVVVRINSSPSEFTLIKDSSTATGLPLNGSYFHTGENQYVLYINGQEKEGDDPKNWPMPVQLELKSSDPELLSDEKTVRELMQQVYRFSHLYWRSLRQPPVPVTISYPKMVAGNAIWFQRQTLPGDVTDVPWFL